MSSRAKRGIYCLSLAALLLSAAASAVDGAVASLNWRLAFGTNAPTAAFGLSLGYRSGDHFAPLSRLVALEVDETATVASVAGLPLMERSYQANQSGAEAAYGAGVETKPWYAKSWVLWTVGGIAATAALGGVSVSNSDERHCTGTCNQNEGGGRTTVVTKDGDGTYVGCVQGTCAVCPDGSVQSTCFMDRGAAAPGFEIRLVRDEDAGTGGMGDL